MADAPVPPCNRASQTWAMLIKRVFEIDPLACPECGGVLKVVAFIEPPQGDVIEKILRHCGLWNPASPRAPPADAKEGHVADEAAEARPSKSSSAGSGERTYVDIDTFLAEF